MRDYATERVGFCKGWRRRFLLGAMLLTAVALILLVVYVAGTSHQLNLVTDLRNAAAWP